MESPDATADVVRAYIEEKIGLDEGTQLGLETPLFWGGLLDSIHLMPLVIFLEDEYGIRIHPLEMTEDNFRNLSVIAALIGRKASRG